MTFIPVCLISEISTEQVKMFVVDGVKILVAKSNDNKIWAFDSMCTHAEKSLENGKWDSKNAQITCPYHRAIFAISQCGLAISPPAVLPIKVYPTEIQMIDSKPTLLINLDV